MRAVLRATTLLSAFATGVALFATPALAAPAEGSIRGAGESGVIRERYIVVLKPGAVSADATSDAAKQLSERFGGKLRKAFSSSLRGFTVRMTESRAKRLAANPLVEYVQQDKTVRLADTTQANPTWGLDRIDQLTPQMSSSYTYTTTAANVTAYVLDTGIRTTHTEFGGRAHSGYDFIDNDADASDCNGHGTHVAGTIGGTTYGVAKGVSLVGVRVLDCAGSGSYSGIVEGIDWVNTHGVKPAVVNMSLGGGASTFLDSAVRASIAQGFVYAVAAGNSNLDACGYSPARTAEAITVGASDFFDNRAWFSNYGTCLDIFAPGESIVSAGHAGDVATRSMSGTSMATPHVAGAAALYLATRPAATPAQVRDALVAAAAQTAVGSTAGSTTRLLYTGPAVAAPPVQPAPAPVYTPPPAPVYVPPCNVRSNDTDMVIRDRGSVTSSVAVGGCAGKASRSTRVEVHITHPRQGDLVVELIAPGGSVKRLKAASKRGAGADVHRVYTANMSKRNKNGVWKLRVRDQYKGNVGFLDTWTLTV